ncbi:MAG: PASTA domain-containing protein [candidate division Zixibacteria bacterium]|nr:PASTA domain-containing protein [candidate division Zixibacteria bacterium]
MIQFPKFQKTSDSNQEEKQPENNSVAGDRALILRRLLYVFISCAALFVIFDNVVMPIVTRQNTEFELPNIIGLTTAEAEEILEEYGLSLEITSEEYNPSYPEGTALTQYPMAGTKVKSGRIIKTVASLGEKYVRIPQVAGISVRQAKLDLETSGLRIGDIAWTYTDTLPEKVVVFSFPSPGDTVKMGSKVSIMVNRGRGLQISYMPNVVGMQLQEAIRLLGKKSLRVGVVKYRLNENVLPETVLEQSEDEATELDVGEEIDLVVSSVE